MHHCGKHGQQSDVPGTRGIIGFFLGLVLGFSLVLGGTGQAGAETPVCGYITADTTWTKANSPYIVTCGVIVDSGITLIIEPGVEVRFNTNCSLTIDGTLIARGTSLDPIVFTNNNQYWAYIHFREGSTGATYDGDDNYVSGSILQYCTVEYAGASAVLNNGALRLEKAHPCIDHCTIKNNMATGINAWDLIGTLKITDSTISHNIEAGSAGGIFLSQRSYPSPNPSGRSRIFNNTISFNEASGNGGGVHLGTADAGVDLVKNVLSNNKATNGGGLYSPEVRNSVSDNIFLQNTATNNGGGMAGLGQTTRNIFSGNQAKSGGAYRTNTAGSNPINYLGINSLLKNTSLNETLYFGYGTIFQNNLVAYNVTTGAPPTWTILVTYTGCRLNKNNFFSNTATYELKNGITADIDATENWWGTAVQTEIQDKISDRLDDPTKGIVDFMPWATVLRTDVPISPPRNLTVTQTPRGPNLTWQANSEGNVAGYKIYWGKTTGYPYSNVRDVGNVTHYSFEPGDLPPGTYYFAVTAYNTNYPMIEDDPATLINEKQTAGYESWFSPEGSGSRSNFALPFLNLLLLDN